MIRSAVAALLAGLALVAAAAPATRTHVDYRRDTVAAYQRHDYPAMRAAARAAVELRPDAPRYLYNLACAETLCGEIPAALVTLRHLAALGVVLPVETDDDFGALRANPGFAPILATFRANRAPRGHAAARLEIPGHAGIVEGIAYAPTSQCFYLGDVHQRCVWRLQTDGTLSRFSDPAAGLLGVFKLGLDEAHHRLWVSTSALPEIAGYTAALKGKGALVALDLRTGKVVQSVPLPEDGRDHCLGDFLQLPDGTIFLTDSTAPVIWRYVPGQDHLERYLESPEFLSLQGIGALADGRLIVSDYANGLFLIDPASRRPTLLRPPEDATLFGIDTFTIRGESLFAVQNGIEPQRVVRITLDPDRNDVRAVAVIAAGQPGFDDLTHFTEEKGRLVVIAGSGWARFEKRTDGVPVTGTVRLFALEP